MRVQVRVLVHVPMYARVLRMCLWRVRAGMHATSARMCAHTHASSHAYRCLYHLQRPACDRHTAQAAYALVRFAAAATYKYTQGHDGVNLGRYIIIRRPGVHGDWCGSAPLERADVARAAPRSNGGQPEQGIFRN